MSDFEEWDRELRISSAAVRINGQLTTWYEFGEMAMAVFDKRAEQNDSDDNWDNYFRGEGWR